MAASPVAVTDWLRVGTKEHGGESCVIFGRSDATINRHGLRMGTSELYSAVEALPEVLDSLVVDLEYLGRESYMPLFVVLRPGLTLDDALRARINGAIRTALSPRFVPDDIFSVAEVPRTARRWPTPAAWTGTRPLHASARRRKTPPDTAPPRCGIRRGLPYRPLPGERAVRWPCTMIDLHTRTLCFSRPHGVLAGRCPLPHYAIVRHGGSSARS